ncbi:hypothetical protein GCM10007853_07380 [Algimonas ampicilliniresistens]|uniref:Uncharacterized protein n=1 Tax=Algimonas ampicilliniresistens TaxID=1298735 RepID=A0ABQ5V5Q1_9PROT|nr:hypothetical protein GCM10007853_07380 [Algimonas ampicilliniresistens]
MSLTLGERGYDYGTDFQSGGLKTAKCRTARDFRVEQAGMSQNVIERPRGITPPNMGKEVHLTKMRLV